MSTHQIRKAFLDFFASKQHHICPSAPMVVKNDPTLMFTNAGMNQFKDLFLGNEPAKYPRVADTQKCLRVSGKHNDLEEVGHDTYHHTMFEMLGNWSFGDYFKAEAIAWAWELLTEVLHIEKDRLYVTVFEGSQQDGLEMDTEAMELWKQFVPEHRILTGNKKDNFWEMGDTGPCGPCSEIHYDSRSDEQRALVDGRERVNRDDPQVIEIWNLVFMQYNRKASGELELLPARHVDTGMGFERLCRVLQHKQSNYDIDLFRHIIGSVEAISGKQYGVKEEWDIAMRVVSDHIRAISFSIADGQIPSNNKAGYVIRRLLRRAVRYGYTFLGLDQPFLYALLPALIEAMGDTFPELKAQQELIQKVIREEEISFLRTLSTGMHLIEDIMARNRKSGQKEVSGKVVFELYDTYGFPLDLTELILRENGMSYDREAFQAEMQAQKERSRNAASVDTGDWVELFPCESTQFLGYDTLEADVRIARFRKVNSRGKTLFQLVFDRTPFYGESGGQTGDCGILESETERLDIVSTQKENNLIIHLSEQLPENPRADFRASVNAEKRLATQGNHSATHLLHQALREILGSHVEQKGSLVSPEGLRFDFSHFSKMSDEEIRRVERRVNQLIREDAPLQEFREIPIEEARREGAMALFGEKYGDKVRMVRFGNSTELCGGTHVAATGRIGLFRILSESAIAAGIRRIEAVTGAQAEEYMDQMLDTVKEARQLFNNTPALVEAVRKTLHENEELRKQMDAFMSEKEQQIAASLLGRADNAGDMKLIVWESDMPAERVKNIAFQLKNTPGPLAFVAGSLTDQKPTLTVMLSQELVDRGLHAGNIAREAAKTMQGGGGGQPFLATAGGKQPEHLSAAIIKAVELIRG